MRDLIVQHLRVAEDIEVQHIVRVSDNAACEFKSSKILFDMKNQTLNSTYVFKQARHGKGLMDGFHTSVRRFITSQNLLNQCLDNLGTLFLLNDNYSGFLYGVTLEITIESLLLSNVLLVALFETL